MASHINQNDTSPNNEVTHANPRRLQPPAQYDDMQIMQRLLWAHQALDGSSHSLPPELSLLTFFYQALCADLHDRLVQPESFSTFSEQEQWNVRRYVYIMDQKMPIQDIRFSRLIRDPRRPAENLVREIIRFRRQAYWARYSEYVDRASRSLQYEFRPPFDELDQGDVAPPAYWKATRDVFRHDLERFDRAVPGQQIPQDGTIVALFKACQVIGIPPCRIQFAIGTFEDHELQHRPLSDFLNGSLERLRVALFNDLTELSAIFPQSKPREQALFYWIIRNIIDAWFAMPGGTRPTSDLNSWQPTEACNKHVENLRNRSSPEVFIASKEAHMQNTTSLVCRAYRETILGSLSDFNSNPQKFIFNASAACHTRIQAFMAITKRREGQLNAFRAADIAVRDVCPWLVVETETRNEKREREAEEAQNALESV